MKILEKTPEKIPLRTPAAPATSLTAPTTSKRIRRHDLDWLRVMAVLLLIPFHSARVFDVFENFYVKSGRNSAGLSWGVIAFLSPWHMPLMFVLAGAATWFALGHRSAEMYAAERTKRLLIPLLFGILVIIPPQTYLAQWSRGVDAVQSYWSFSGDLSGYTGGWTLGHLWFIAFLLIFSLVALPLLVRWHRRPIGARWLLFAMPLILHFANDLPAQKEGPQNPWYSFALFIGGFLLVADQRAERLIHRSWRPLLATAVVTMAAVLLVWHSGVNQTFVDGSAIEFGFSILEQVNAWVWVLALLGLGHAFLNRENRVLRYANPAAYPFYLLHQTVIVAVAYILVQWNARVWTQYGAVVLTSLALTLGLYELVVRRTNATRFLFGLKPLPRPPVRGSGARAACDGVRCRRAWPGSTGGSADRPGAHRHRAGCSGPVDVADHDLGVPPRHRLRGPRRDDGLDRMGDRVTAIPSRGVREGRGGSDG